MGVFLVCLKKISIYFVGFKIFLYIYVNKTDKEMKFKTVLTGSDIIIDNSSNVNINGIVYGDEIENYHDDIYTHSSSNTVNSLEVYWIVHVNKTADKVKSIHVSVDRVEIYSNNSDIAFEQKNPITKSLIEEYIHVVSDDLDWSNGVEVLQVELEEEGLIIHFD